nr:MAG TPA: hypothetical protein [Caudoviricetes sp.]
MWWWVKIIAKGCSGVVFRGNIKFVAALIFW